MSSPGLVDVGSTAAAGSAGHAVEGAPCPFLARAWWGDLLVAESTAAVRVEEPGRPPALYFPVGHVRLDVFHDEGHRTACPVKGTARLWSIAPSPAAGRGAAGGATRGDPSSAQHDDPASSSTGVTSPDEVAVPDGYVGLSEAAGPDGSGGAGETGGTGGGSDVVWSFDEPAPGLEWLRGLAAFDHDRVRVELLDNREGDAPRDVTIKRFPNWGDASHLADLLDVRPDGQGRYLGAARADWRRPVVEGSQMLGQAIVAAARHGSGRGRRPVSAHMVFVRPADARQPLRFDLDELSAGRTFTTLGVDVTQSGRRCATGTLLLDVTAPDVIRHAAAPPDVAGPYESEPYDMSVTGRDVRIVDGAYTGDPDAPTGPPVLDVWVRFRGRGLPGDPAVHAGLLAQFTGHMSIAAAMRPHAGIGQDQAHRTLSTGINTITLSLHREVRVDRWMLYHHVSTFAGDGMTHAECRVHDQDGDLLASFTVDAMVRPFPGGTTAVDERTAL